MSLSTTRRVEVEKARELLQSFGLGEFMEVKYNLESVITQIDMKDGFQSKKQEIYTLDKNGHPVVSAYSFSITKP
jgi:hypothetical protein